MNCTCILYKILEDYMLFNGWYNGLWNDVTGSFVIGFNLLEEMFYVSGTFLFLSNLLP